MWPTQPFPTRPAAFEYQGATIDDLVDFTPAIRQMAIDAVEGFRLGPVFTPQSLRGTIQRPSAGGGANWSGAGVDPETGLLYVPSVNAFSVRNYRAPAPGEGAPLNIIEARGAGTRSPTMPLIYALTTGGSTGGPQLLAVDKASGEQLASVDLPRGAIGTPMTYLVNDRQYIALTIGGSPVPEVIALALPE